MTQGPNHGALPLGGSPPADSDREALAVDLETGQASEDKLVWKEALAVLAVVAVLVIRWLWGA